METFHAQTSTNDWQDLSLLVPYVYYHARIETRHIQRCGVSKHEIDILAAKLLEAHMTNCFVKGAQTHECFNDNDGLLVWVCLEKVPEDLSKQLLNLNIELVRVLQQIGEAYSVYARNSLTHAFDHRQRRWNDMLRYRVFSESNFSQRQADIENYVCLKMNSIIPSVLCFGLLTSSTA